MNRESLLFLTAFFLVLCTQAIPPKFAKIHKYTFVGPFNSTIQAYGNFDIKQVCWFEDKDEYNQVQPNLNKMMDYYKQSQFQKGPTYALEFYRDSSLRTITYVLFKTSGSVVKKYYALKTELNNTLYYLGVETTFNVRPGNQLPLLSYTHLNPKEYSKFIESAGSSCKRQFQIPKVAEFKYWVFPQATFYLIRYMNDNSSSIYYSFLNTSKGVTYLEQALVSQFVSTPPNLDLFYLMNGLRRIAARYYINYPQLNFISNQSGMYKLVFAQVYLDKVYQDHLIFMLNIDYGISFSIQQRIPRYVQVMTLIATAKTAIFPQIPSFEQIQILYLKSYSNVSQNKFHSSAYFNLNDNDERMGTNFTNDAHRKTTLTYIGAEADPKIFSFFYIRLPNNKKIQSIVFNTHNITMHFINTYLKVRWERCLTAPNTTFYQPDQKAIMERREAYMYEYYRTMGTNQFFNYYSRMQTECQNYCTIVKDRFQVGLIYRIEGKGNPVFRFVLFRDIQNNQVVNIYQNRFSSWVYRSNASENACFYQPQPLCSRLKNVNLNSTERTTFFNDAQSVLTDRNNNQFKLEEFKDVYKVNDPEGIQFWIVVAYKNGFEATLIVNKNSGKWQLLNYGEPPANLNNNIPSNNNKTSDNTNSSKNGSSSQNGNSSQNSSSNSSQNGSSNNNGSSKSNISDSSSKDQGSKSNSSSPNNGGNANNGSSVPPFSFKGNGNLNNETLNSQFLPSLMNVVKANSKGSCTNINQVSYYTDPFAKLLAFMLACPEQSGFTVYEVVVLLSNNTYFFAGKRSLIVIPQNYWYFNIVQPSPALIKTVNSSLSANFTKELAFESVLFVSQFSFVAGELDSVEAKLSDGTKVQQQLLFVNGSWVTLGMRVVQMGTGSNKSEQTTPTNNKNQSSNTSPTPYPSPNNTSPATNNKTTPSNQSNSSSQSNSPCKPSAYLGLPAPSPSAAIYDGLTPKQVREDPYILLVYNKTRQHLPSYVTSLSIKDVRKGTFVNGSVSYQIYFGPQNTSKRTHFITFVYDPKASKLLAFQIIQIIVSSLDQLKDSSSSKPSFDPSSSSSSSRNTSGNSSSRNNSNPSSSNKSSNGKSPSQKSGGPSDANSRSKIEKTLIEWAVKYHFELSNYKTVTIQVMNVQKNIAMYTLTFETLHKKYYRCKFRVDFDHHTVKEISFSQFHY